MCARSIRRGLIIVSSTIVSSTIAAGCRAPPERRVIETFAASPSGWGEYRDGRIEPAQLVADGYRLDIDGTRALFCPLAFDAPTCSVDVAALGGDPQSFAGLVLTESTKPDVFWVVATRASGEWRVYRSSEPSQPRGGEGWQPLPDDDEVAGYHRFGAIVRAGAISFSIDGRPVGNLAVDGTEEAGSWRVGIVVGAGSARCNNFIAGEAKDGFRPEAHGDWGGDAISAARQSEFAAAVREFRRNPSRAGIFAMRASLDGAAVAASQGAVIESRGVEIASELTAAARRIGETRLMGRAFRATRFASETRDFGSLSRDARAAGNRTVALVYSVAGAVTTGSAAEVEATEQLAALRPFSYSFEFDDSRASEEIVTRRSVAGVVQSAYGALVVRDESDLEIWVDIDRASIDRVREADVTRAVAVASTGDGLAPSLASELSRLDEQFPAELEQARTRAGVIRVGSQTLGPSSLAALDEFATGSETLELHVDDGRRLERLHARLMELRAKQAAAKEATIREETIAATRTSTSILCEVSVDVRYRGRKVVSLDSFRAYASVEAWTHDADSAKGIPASKPDPSEVEAARVSVRDRILRGIANAVSRESVLGALSADEKLGFLLRLTRTTRAETDILRLKWHLQQAFVFSPELRDAVANRLLSPP